MLDSYYTEKLLGSQEAEIKNITKSQEKYEIAIEQPRKTCIRQAVWAFEAVRKEIQKQFSKKHHIYFKRSRYLLLKHPDKLHREKQVEQTINRRECQRTQKRIAKRQGCGILPV